MLNLSDSLPVGFSVQILHRIVSHGSWFQFGLHQGPKKTLCRCGLIRTSSDLRASVHRCVSRRINEAYTQSADCSLCRAGLDLTSGTEQRRARTDTGQWSVRSGHYTDPLTSVISERFVYWTGRQESECHECFSTG